MPHYAYVLSVSRLQLPAHIGFYEKERNEKQLVEISFRLYFDHPISSNHDDKGEFFDYAKLSDHLRVFVESQKFNLIEYMGMALFRHLRAEVDRLGGASAKLWVQMNKIHAPVPGLLGGASFVHSDLPADATFIPSVYV